MPVSGSVCLPPPVTRSGVAKSPQAQGGPSYVQLERQQRVFSFPHRKLHSGVKTYGCELCGKRFLDSLRLRMHLLAHSGRRGCPTGPFILPTPVPTQNVGVPASSPDPTVLPPGSRSREATPTV